MLMKSAPAFVHLILARLIVAEIGKINEADIPALKAAVIATVSRVLGV